MKVILPGRTVASRGVALVTVLIIVSAIAMIVVSYLALTRHDLQRSSYQMDGLRAELAAQSAFEEAKNLLLKHTANDRYLVTAVTMAGDERSEEGDEMPWRYTFLQVPGEEQMFQQPLFSGMPAASIDMPEVSVTETKDLVENRIGAPVAEFADPEALTRAIETFGLTHRIGASRVAENRRVPTGFVDAGPVNGDDRFRARYAYWIEDLQGFPNIDAIGDGTDHFMDSDGGSRHLDQIRGGYSSTDRRTEPGKQSDDAGARIELSDQDSTFAYQFPKAYRGQQLFDQIAPGLSPREIHFYPWQSGAGSMARHPFVSAPKLGSQRQAAIAANAFSGLGADVENRFSAGLKPYRERPLIPFGHGYVDEGRPRVNINRLIAGRSISRPGDDDGIGFVEMVTRNLPDFASERRGAFPVEEDYLATLGANLMDYADADSAPTLPGNAAGGGRRFRGVDSYPVVNEFFVKFLYDGYSVDGANFKVRFIATPWVEFWNPSNQSASIDNLRLKFRITEHMQLDGPGFNNTYRLDDVGGEKNRHIIRDDAFDSLVSVTLEPNEYRVVPFGDIEWKVNVDRKGTSSFQISPGVYNVSGSGSKSGKARAHYQLYWNDQLIDQSGRAFPGDNTSPPAHGFVFLPLVDGRLGSSLHPKDLESNGDAQLQTGEYMIRATAAGLGTSLGTPDGSHFGDPWMAYYSAGTQENEYYTRDASPGGRNYRYDKVESPSREDVFRDQQRISDWPDRGFESEQNANHPDKPSLAPDAVPAAVTAQHLAPWRISNLGRLYSLSELGNLHDPHMWRGEPVSESSRYARNPVSLQRYNRSVGGGMLKEFVVWDLPAEDDSQFQAVADPQFGGGSTLRIGRREFSLFDRDGVRASQLLDLFHVGTPGTNLPFGELKAGGFEADFSEDAYEKYDPRHHRLPPSAPNPVLATGKPFADVYPPDLHAMGAYRKIFGQININSAPTAFEIEALLRGPFATSDVIADSDGSGGLTYQRPADEDSLVNALDENAVERIAERLLALRPYYSPSHLARVIGHLIEEEQALPEYHTDAVAEETFARVLNGTNLSSRHFRIFTYGEIIETAGQSVVGRAARVFEVFLRPTRNADGSIYSVTCEVLSVREL